MCLRIFSVQHRQKNKNIQPGPEKQHSYQKKRVYYHSKNDLLDLKKSLKQKLAVLKRIKMQMEQPEYRSHALIIFALFCCFFLVNIETRFFFQT